jgi:Flp pilus assembly pilin Flp
LPQQLFKVVSRGIASRGNISYKNEGFMKVNLLRYLTKFYQENNGQAVTEYGAIIAFVSLLFAMVFSVSHGGLYQALSTALGQTINALNTLSNASAS